jgi:hypothetical protein
MRDVPMVNATLQVRAVGFGLHEGRPSGRPDVSRGS